LKQGRTVTAISVLGMDLKEKLVEDVIGKTTFADLYTPDDATTRPEENETPVSFSLQLDNWESAFDHTFVLTPADSCKISGADTIPAVNTFIVNSTGDKLLIDNFLTSSFTLYSKAGKEWISPVSLCPSLEEDTMFIDQSIDPAIYQYFKEMNIFVSMYLNAAFTKQNIYLTASLPQVEMTKKDSSVSLGYSNMPVCLIKNDRAETIRTFLLNGIIENEPYVYLHSDGLFFEEDSLFVFPLQKGWPVIGTKALPSEKENNPFLPEFYDDAKTILFYNAHTHDYMVAAPLDSLYRKHRLGYFVNTPLVKKWNNRYYWTDTRLGKIYVLAEGYDSSDLVCDLFGMDALVQSKPYTEDLLYMESYNPIFKRKVIDFEALDNGQCIALVSDGSHYYFYYTTSKGLVNNAAFPDKIGNKAINGLQLGADSKGNRIAYGLYQDNWEIIVYSFHLSEIQK
jgi:hypothetical protein